MNEPNGTEDARRLARGGPGRRAPVPTAHGATHDGANGGASGGASGGGGRGTLLLALAGAHLPLWVVVAYLALSFPGGPAKALPVVGVALAGTLAAGAIAFRELRALLASVRRASQALRDYRERGRTPRMPADTYVGGEGGALLREVQQTVCRLDGVIGSLERLSAKDPLTGAYNRRACEERLAEDAARATRGEGRLALAVVDADRLKEVNDRWGHGAGDACLRHLAHALGRSIREGDWVARWGGDEFVVAFWGVEGPADPRAALRRCGEYLERNPVRFSRRGEGAAGDGAEEVRVGFSAGVYTHGGAEGARELFSKADAALIAAKKGGRGRVVAFGADVHTEAHAAADEAPSVNGLHQGRPESPPPALDYSLSTPGRPVRELPRPPRTPPRAPKTRAEKGGES